MPIVPRLAEGGAPEERDPDVPDLTVQWQAYLLSPYKTPGEVPPPRLPGLFRDPWGDTWLRTGDGTEMKLGGTSPSPGPTPIISSIRFTEGPGGGTTNQSMPIPAGSTLKSVTVVNDVGWSGYAQMQIGDPSSASRYFNGVLGNTVGQVAAVAPMEEYPTASELRISVSTGGTGTPTGSTLVTMELLPSVVTVMVGEET